MDDLNQIAKALSFARKYQPNNDADPKANILMQVDMLLENIGEQGAKATAKGNLPRKLS